MSVDSLRTKRKREYMSLMKTKRDEQNQRIKTVINEFHDALLDDNSEYHEEMKNMTHAFYEETERLIRNEMKVIELDIPKCMYKDRKGKECINDGFKLGETGKWKGKMMCKKHWPQTQMMCDVAGCKRRGCQKHCFPESPPNPEKEKRMNDFMTGIQLD